MKVGIAGLNGLYWPVAMGNGFTAKKGVQFLAAATLGESDAAIKASLGLSPAEYAGRYGVKLYKNAEEMVKSEVLDAVVIVTPHSQHAEWVERLAGLGVNIFIPKTFATTAEDGARIVQAGKKNEVKVAVGPSARYLPPMLAVKRALEEGLIGEPFSARICHHHGVIDVFDKSDWYRNPTEGGPELSLGWYGIDLALHFMQDNVKSVFAKYGNYTSPESPFMDCGRIELNMARGGAVSFDMYFCNRFNYPSWQMEILGPKGVLSIIRSGRDPSTSIVCLNNAEGVKELPLPQETPHWEMFWVDEFLEGRELSVSAEYAHQVTLISLAARQSASLNQVVNLS